MPSLPETDVAVTPDAAGVRRRLLTWYHAAHRDFPWRGLTDPYAVLVSEVMLQQTQHSWNMPEHCEHRGTLALP